MTLIIRFLRALLASMRSRAALATENLILRQQLIVLGRKAPRRARLTNLDRLLFVLAYRAFPSIADAIRIVKPETVIRWHRAGFRPYWRWKSRSAGGRPAIEASVRKLIREMSLANPIWGAPRIHGELLKLGIEVAQSTVAKYMPAKGFRPPSQGWKSFPRNQAAGIAATDMFVVPTISFRLLYGLVILRHNRRRLVSFGVTSHPTAEWLARQLAEAFPWDEAPRYLLRDRDRAYGDVFRRRMRAMGIRDRPIAARSPWQNGHVERLIGSIRRECLDHVIVFGELHLQRTLKKYCAYYNEVRTHLCLNKDAPLYREVQRYGHITALPVLGGLHHYYARI